MFKSLDNLLAPEWYKAIRPVGIGTAVLRTFRVLLSPLRVIPEAPLAAAWNTNVSALYNTCQVTLSDIPLAYTCAGNATVAGESTIFGQGTAQFKYILPLSIAGIQMFGCGYAAKAALRNIDYIEEYGVYKFKEHPSAFGTVAGNNLLLTTCGGLPLTDTGRLNARFYSSSDITVRRMVQYVTSDKVPWGNSFAPYMAAQSGFAGDALSARISRTWTDTGAEYTLGISDNGLHLWVHNSSGVHLIPGGIPDMSRLYSTTAYKLSLPSGDYPVVQGRNDVWRYPGIRKEFPALSIASDGTFSGLELQQLLRNLSCKFIDFNYINSGADHQTIGKYIMPDNRQSVLLHTPVSTVNLALTCNGSVFSSTPGVMQITFRSVSHMVTNIT